MLQSSGMLGRNPFDENNRLKYIYVLLYTVAIVGLSQDSKV